MKKAKYLFLPFLLMPLFVFAQTDTTLSDLQVQIQSLLGQINDLQTQLTEVQKGDRGTIKKELQSVRKEFRTYLKRGTTGDEVTQIQEILAQYPEIYPEGLVTGYYGLLTEKAVARFQSKYGIEQVGVVGPKTRAKLNSLFVTASGKTPPGLTKKFQTSLTTSTATSTATSTPDGDDDDDTATSTDTVGGVGKITLCHKVDRKNPNTLSVGIPATLAHLLHGDTIGACSAGGGTGDEGDNGDGGDVTAPIISNISASSTTASTTSILWNTDEDSDSKVTYSTSTPVSTATTTLTTAVSVLMTSHDVSLIDLTASTTYYYFVGSTDASENSATSSEQLFITQ